MPRPTIGSGTAAVRADSMTSAPGVSSANETTIQPLRTGKTSTETEAAIYEWIA
ncbi:hypothetical protein EV646_11377 [Kribbella antiqua]|uniref:Uncharacterized protein n=1 Tax=Kribbella antiqua TaxID=2512217 RepID=A0A4R2IIA9_9ACTN|nr:hypothetical protein EV646_11377 [Kribbella antiqua]